MTNLTDLIEKVEGASGPDRELDGEIARQCSGHEVQRVTIGPDHRREDWTFIDRNGAAPVSRPVPRYTESIDAAMSLVPDGWRPIEILHEAIDRCGSAAQLFGADRDAVFLKRLPQFVAAACLRGRVEKEGL